MDWFEGTTGKAQLVLGTGKSYPYMSIVWVDGELDHVRIYAFKDKNHYSWGVLENSPTLKDRFAVTDLELRF